MIHLSSSDELEEKEGGGPCKKQQQLSQQDSNDKEEESNIGAMYSCVSANYVVPPEVSTETERGVFVCVCVFNAQSSSYYNIISSRENERGNKNKREVGESSTKHQSRREQHQTPKERQ